MLGKLTGQNKALLKKDIDLYDTGQTTEVEAPNVSISKTPKIQPTNPNLQNFGSNLGENRVGFMRKNVFSSLTQAPEQGQSIPTWDTQMGFDAELERQRSIFDLTGVTNNSSERHREAALNSNVDLNAFGAPPTDGGMVTRSVMYGIGHLFDFAADVNDLVVATTQMLGGTLEEKGQEMRSDAQGEGFQDSSGAYLETLGEGVKKRGEAGALIGSPMAPIANHIFGVNLSEKFSDSFRGIADWIHEKSGRDEKVLPHRDPRLNQGFFDWGEEDESLAIRARQFFTNTKWENMLLPDFWLTDVAEQIPNLVFFMGSGKIAQLATRGAIKQLTKQFPKTAGSFFSRKVITDKGVKAAFKRFGMKAVGESSKWSVTGAQLIEYVGAGMGANMAEGLVISGETYHRILAETGDKELAATHAWGVMLHNAAFFPIDVFHYAVLTKGLSGLRKGLRVTTKNGFKRRLLPALTSMGLYTSSGHFEMFQEVFQDWAMYKKTQQALGEDYMSYMDYMRSPDAAHTKVVSFAMGLLMPFGGDAMSLVYDNSEEAKKKKEMINELAEGEDFLNRYIEVNGINQHWSESVVGPTRQRQDDLKKFYLTEAMKPGGMDRVNEMLDFLVALPEGKGITQEEKQKHSDEIAALKEALDPYRGEPLEAFEPDAVREIADKAYQLGAVKSMLAEDNKFYDDQIEKAKTVFKGKRLEKAIARIEKERAAMVEQRTNDIKGIQSAIDAIFSHENNRLRKIGKELKKKRVKVSPEKTEKTVKKVKPTKKKKTQSTELKIKKYIRAAKKGDKKLLSTAEYRQIYDNNKKEIEKILREEKAKEKGAKEKGKGIIKKVAGQRGRKQIERAKKNLSKAKGYKEIANAIQKFNLNVYNGAVVTAEEKALFKKAEEELKKEGYTIGKLLGKEWNEGDLLKVQMVQSLEAQGIERGDTPPQAIKFIITDVVKPQISKDGKQIQAAEVRTKEVVLTNEEIDKKIEKLKKQIKALKKLKADTTAYEEDIAVLEEFKKKNVGPNTRALLENVKEESKSVQEKRKEASKKENNKGSVDDMKNYKQGTLFSTEKTGEKKTKRSIGAERILRNILRKKGVNLVMFNHFKSTDAGIRYYGLAQGLSIFLDAENATHETLFEELSHIFLADMWEDGAVKKARKEIHKHPVFEQIREEYWHFTLFKKKGKGGRIAKVSDIIMEEGIMPLYQWKKENKDGTNVDYLKYVQGELKEKNWVKKADATQYYLQQEAMFKAMQLVRNKKIKELEAMDSWFLVDAAKGLFEFGQHVYGKIKTRYTKEEAAEILEETGNEEFVSEELEALISDVISDFKNHEGKYSRIGWRKGDPERQGFHNGLLRKVAVGTSRDRDKVVADVMKMIEAHMKDDGFAEERDSWKYKGSGLKKYNAAGIQRIERYIESKGEDILKFVDELRDNNIINDIEHQYFYENKNLTNLLDELVEREVKKQSGEFNEDFNSEEIESVIHEIYSDTKNGVSKTVTTTMDEFIKKSQDENISKNILVASLLDSVWNKAQNGQDFKLYIESLFASMYEGEKLTIEEKNLAEYFLFLEEYYLANERKGNDALIDVYNDLDKFTSYDFVSQRMVVGGEVVEDRYSDFKEMGIANNIKENFLEKLRVQPWKKGQDKISDTESLTASQVKRLGYTSRLGQLYLLNKNEKTTNQEGRRLVAEFLNSFFVPGDLSYSLEDIMKLKSLKTRESRQQLIEELIEETSQVTFRTSENVDPKQRQKAGNAGVDAFSKKFLPQKNIGSMENPEWQNLNEKEKIAAFRKIQYSFNIWANTVLKKIHNEFMSSETMSEEEIKKDFQEFKKGLLAILNRSWYNSSFDGRSRQRQQRMVFHLGKYYLDKRDNVMRAQSIMFRDRKKVTEESEIAWIEKWMAPNLDMISTPNKNLLQGNHRVKQLALEIAENIRSREFSLMVKSPTNKQSNKIAKKNAIDYTIEHLSNLPIEILENTYGKDNVIVQMIKQLNYTPVIKPLIGGVVYGLENEYSFDKAAVSETIGSVIAMELALKAIINNEKYYSQNVAQFGDKNTKYSWTNAPLWETKKGKEVLKKIAQSNRGKFMNGNSYVKEVTNKDIADFVKDLKKKNEAGILTNNLSTLLETYENEKYKKTAELTIERILISKRLNKFYSTEMFIGNINNFKNIEDLIARSMHSVAPKVSMGKEYRHEHIMMQDIKVFVKGDKMEFVEGLNKEKQESLKKKGYVEANATDAVSLVLSKDGDTIRARFGGLRMVGNHFKFVNSGHELTNTTYQEKFSGNPFYFKTNTFEMSQEMLENSPLLQKVSELMEKRKSVIGDNTLLFLTFSSAVKIQGKELGKYVNSLTIEKLSEMTPAALNNHLNKYSKFENEQGVQYGLDGQSLGIQLELDGNSKTSIFGRQIQQHLMGFGLEGNVVKILELGAKYNNETSGKKLKNYLFTPRKKGSYKKGEKRIDMLKRRLAKQRQFIYESAKEVGVFSESVLKLLQEGSYDNNTMSILKRSLSAQFTKSLQKRGPGGTLTQLTGLFFKTGEKSTFEGDPGLKGYVKNSEGEIVKPMEIAIGEDSEFKVGDIVYAQRLPTSIVPDVIYGKVVKTVKGVGNTIFVPIEAIAKDGSDFDGDQRQTVRMYRNDEMNKPGAKTWNDMMKLIFKLISSKEFKNIMNASIEYTEAAETAIQSSNKIWGFKDSIKGQTDMTFVGEEKIGRFIREAKHNINIAAAQNTVQKILSAHKVYFDEKVNGLNKINGKDIGTVFSKKLDAVIAMAYRLNIIVDDIKKGYASKLNMNRYTMNAYFQLLGRGVDFKTAATILNSPPIRFFVEEMQNVSHLSTAEQENHKNYLYAEMRKRYSVPEQGLINIKITEGTHGKLAEAGIVQLFERLNNESMLGAIAAIQQIANIENSMPRTLPRALDLFKRAVSLGYGYQAKFAGMIMTSGDAALINNENMVYYEDGVQYMEIPHEEMVAMVAMGDIDFFVENMKFNNPYLQQRFERLAELISQYKNDPVYKNGNEEIINKLFPLNEDFKNYAGEEKIERAEEKVRTFLLSEREDLYDLNLVQVFENLYDSAEEFNKIYSPETSIEELLNLSLVQIEKLMESGHHSYDYLNNWFKVERKKTRDNEGYVSLRSAELGVAGIFIQDGKIVAENLIKQRKENDVVLRVKDEAKESGKEEFIKRDWNKLSPKIKKFLMVYDLIMNDHTGPNAILPFMYGKKYREAIRTATMQQGLSESTDSHNTDYVDHVAKFVRLSTKKDHIKITKEQLKNAKTSGEGVVHDRIRIPVLDAARNLVEGKIYAVDLEVSSVEMGVVTTNRAASKNITALYTARKVAGGGIVDYVISSMESGIGEIGLRLANSMGIRTAGISQTGTPSNENLGVKEGKELNKEEAMEENIKQSDLTIYFRGDPKDFKGDYSKTKSLAKKHGKMFVDVFQAGGVDYLHKKIREAKKQKSRKGDTTPFVLNIAGDSMNQLKKTEGSSTRFQMIFADTLALSDYELIPIKESFVRDRVMAGKFERASHDMSIESQTVVEINQEEKLFIKYKKPESTKETKVVPNTDKKTEIEKDVPTRKVHRSFGKNAKEGITGETEFDAITRGERTQATLFDNQADLGFFARLKVGDIIKVQSKDGKEALIKITKPFRKMIGSGLTPLQWTENEGYSKEYFQKEVWPKKDSAFVINFEYVSNADLSDSLMSVAPDQQAAKEDDYVSRDNLTEFQYFSILYPNDKINIETLDKDTREGLRNMYEKYKKDIVKAKARIEELKKFDTLKKKRVIDAMTNQEIIDEISSTVKNMDTVARRELLSMLEQSLGQNVAVKTLQDWINSAIEKKYEDKIINELENIKARAAAGDLGVDDISFLQKWLSPDITSKQRPEIAHIENVLHKEKINYRRDMHKLEAVQEKAFNDLLDDRFKKSAGPFKFLLSGIDIGITRIPGLYGMIPKYMFNRFVFQNLVHDVEGVHEGKYYRDFRLKRFKDKKGRVIMTDEWNKLSQAEKNYYDMYRGMTDMIQKHLNTKKDINGESILEEGRVRDHYIPNMKGSRLELSLARNMTAAYIAHNYESKLREVVIEGTNLLTGEKYKDTLGHFINIARLAQMENKRRTSKNKKNKTYSVKQDKAMMDEVRKMIKESQNYFKKGYDAEGNPVVRLEDVAAHSEGIHTRHLKKRSGRAEFEASWNIHGALQEYTQKMVFEYGLDSPNISPANVGAPGKFVSVGHQEKSLMIDAIATYSEWKGNPAAKEWVDTILKDAYYGKKGRKSLISENKELTLVDKIMDGLVKWTYIVGLGLRASAGFFNIAIGNYNTIRQQGFKKWGRGELRFFGHKKGTASLFDRVTMRKVSAITKAVGLINDAQAQVTEGFWNNGLTGFIFMFMSGSEKFIQRVGFVAQIEDKHWDSFTVDKNGDIVVLDQTLFDELIELSDEYKDNVYDVQGRGYTDLDQRVIQQYSIVNAVMTFKRWFLTFLKDRLAKEHINRFGKLKVGSITGTATFFKDIILEQRKFNPADIMKEYHKLDKEGKSHYKLAIDKFMRGNGIIFFFTILLLAAGDDDKEKEGVLKTMDKMRQDMMLIVSIDRLWWMASVPALQTAENISMGFYHLTSGSVYERKGKYGLKGQKRYRSYFARAMPHFARGIFTVE